MPQDRRNLIVALASLLALGATACSRNREADTQKVIDELFTLDQAVMDIVKAEPNAAGLAKAEALVDAKQHFNRREPLAG